MNKKTVKIISVLICLVSFFCSGCNNQETQVNENSNVILINSFDSYFDVYDFYYSGSFKLDCVKDSQYITQGEGAIKYSVSNQASTVATTNTLAVPLYNLEGAKNYRDLSRASKITYDVYNDSADSIVIGTSILQKKIGLMYSNSKTVTVAAGESATITYSINPYEIYYAIGIDSATHININVTGVNPVVYFDNMQIHYGSADFTAPEVTIDEGEVLSFEKTYQGFVVYTTGTTLKTEVVSNAEEASEGFRYARIFREGVADGTIFYGGKFGISANYLNNINFSLATDSYIAFDYKATWSGSTMWIVPRLVATSTNAYYNINNVRLPTDQSWHTVCIPFSLAPAFFDNLELSFDGGTYGDVYVDNFRIITETPADAIMATGK